MNSNHNIPNDTEPFVNAVYDPYLGSNLLNIRTAKGNYMISLTYQ